MKRLSFATLWLLVLSGGGLWAAPSATPARKNLYDLSNYMESTDKRLPGAVRQAANGIYEMLVTTPAQRFLIQSELEALAKPAKPHAIHRNPPRLKRMVHRRPLRAPEDRRLRRSVPGRRISFFGRPRRSPFRSRPPARRFRGALPRANPTAA